jgi:2-polyprenyl-6-methoxyphenol hydroxylase-like FAD-dependent oxidoreductase
MVGAFRDAELLAEAIETGLGGDLAAALRRYQQDRDSAALPMYELTCGLADLTAPPAPEMLELFSALQGRPEHIARFLGLIAGSVAIADFFAPESLGAITGAQLAA